MSILRRFFLIFSILSLSLNFSVAQYTIKSVKNTPTGLDISISFVESKNEIKLTDAKRIIDYFESTDPSKPGYPKLPSSVVYIAIPPNSKLNAEIINSDIDIIADVIPESNPEVIKSSDSTYIYKSTRLLEKLFLTEYYPAEELEILGYTWVNNRYCAVLKINTHRFGWKNREIRVLKSLEIKTYFDQKVMSKVNTTSPSGSNEILSKLVVNYNMVSEARPSAVAPVKNSSNDWIDYSTEYLKFAIPKDGIYRITYDDFTNYGVNPSAINPKTFKLFLKGNQIPIYVNGEDDLTFDKGDYIEFWGEKNYGDKDYRMIVSKGNDYKNFMNRYSDTAVVWINWGKEEGLRISKSSLNTSAVLDTIKSSLVKLHLESDQRLWFYDPVDPRVQLPNWQENKVWTWLVLGSSGSQSINFSAKNILPNSIVKSYTRLISNASDIQIKAHKNGVSINSTVFQDTLSYDYRSTVNIESKYSSSVLKEGNNIFRVFGLPTKASFQQSLLDWIDIDYFQSNIAVNDSIQITIPDPVKTNIRAIKISNVKLTQSNIVLYKIKSNFKMFENYNYNLSKGEIVFIDTVQAGDKYFLGRKSNYEIPKFIENKLFKNISSKQNSAQYVVITHRSLIQSAQEYQKFISSSYNIKTGLFLMDDIYDEFSYGTKSAESIKEFLMNANYNWTDIKPLYLLLIGDANYDYKDVYTPAPAIRKKDLVPSFGNPVSDVWYTIWDNSNLAVPQMSVGRIPASNNDQVLFYLNKHKSYLNKPYDEWNKDYLLFSGGDAQNPSELAQIKAVNDAVLNNIITVKPVGGNGTHFYKTLSPPTNLGPYSSDVISSKIANGGIIVSYVGHSGTQTWDNGITKVEDIKNSYQDRFPLISDFGCSTGKFAEPDVDAFGELFISIDNSGQAINYLGNSSFGYLSTSTKFPILFYEELLKNQTQSVGQIHNIAKLKLIEQTGISDVNNVFIYCNLLFGDPIIKIKIPPKPNFFIDKNSIEILNKDITDGLDSISIKIKVNNYGLVTDEALKIRITDTFNSVIVFDINKNINSPLFQDSLTLKIPVKKKPGLHNLEVQIDPDNLFDEITKTDNYAELEFNVYSSSIKFIVSDKFYLTKQNGITVLNPTTALDIKNPIIQVSYSEDPGFASSRTLEKSVDTLVTKFTFVNLIPDKRYYWRSRINGNSLGDWSDTYSFLNTNIPYKWYYQPSFLNDDVIFKSIIYDSTMGVLKLENKSKNLKLISAGSNEGKFASLKINSEETLPNSFFWGIATALIDTVSLTPHSFRYFLYPSATSGTLLKQYIDSLTVGTVLALTICDDGAQSVLGFSTGTPVRKAIETLGSQYINNVGYRESWCMIGIKGAPKGSVAEDYKKIYEGQAIIELNKMVHADSGTVILPVISNSVRWKDFTISRSIPNGSQLLLYPIGEKNDGKTDTLQVMDLKDSTKSLSGINASIYPKLKFMVKMFANSKKESPEINTVGVNYNGSSELALNYQVVTVAKDSLDQGENINLSFYVYNVGESKAENFKVNVELIKKDNSHEKIFQTIVDSLGSQQNKFFNVLYNTSDINGPVQLNINIDPENKILELYKDNNLYPVSIYIKPNTMPASLKLTFDGNDIINGDFVSANPNIRIELSDQSLVPIRDTTAVQIYLNNKQIYFNNNSNLSYSFSTSNPKFTVDYKPILESGFYFMKIIGRNATGALIDSAGVTRKFEVQKDLQLLDVYNYPNPFKDETFFTFKLTQLPDELKIKIFTIAGRMIKEINLTSAELKYDFNKIYWDGRDTDGELIANGVYLYKIISKKGNESAQTIQKLAIVR
ncbi:MAG: C25 family cysteine peptidase [Ignavibacteriales bacterium]|nr:C25 family cysteine peptidase [Ignavibacteriales bacterium]